MDAATLEDVCKLGRYPVDRKSVKNDGEKEERNLARLIRKARPRLQHHTILFLDALRTQKLHKRLRKKTTVPSSGGSHTAAPRKRLYADFYAGCRSPNRWRLEPFPTALESQCGSGRFRPFQCLEHLALIELVDTSVEKCPYEHDDLLNMIHTQRERERDLRVSSLK